MAAFGASFESSSSIDERREQKRQARQEAIERAKQNYEREEKKKELKRLRGEDTWMLPEVNQRLQELEDEGNVKSKKKKKEKKAKKKKEKKKKSKKEKTTGDDSSEGSEDSGEGEWVEAQPQTQAAKPWQISEKPKQPESNRESPAQNAERDQWMTFDFLAMDTTSTTERRAERERLKEEKAAKARAVEQASIDKLELNPFWKNGGTGLPPVENASTVAKKGSSIINDGGLSWLRKNYQRMKEQAEREQRSLNDVVAERYGSMEIFQQRLAEAEGAVYGQRRGGGAPMRGGWRRNESERDSSPLERDQRRGGRGEEGERAGYRGEERGRVGDGYRDRGDRNRERGRDRDWEEDGDRERDRDRRRDRDWDRERGRDREREEDGDRERDRERRRDREREEERDGERKRDRETDRERERNREKDQPSSSSSSSWNQRPPALSSLKGRCFKPSEDDDGDEAPERRPPARPSKSFMRPSSDDEGSTPSNTSLKPWKKNNPPPPESDTTEEPQQEKDGKPAVAPQDDKASSSESESEEEVEVVPVLSEEEMNKLASELVKAEIRGKTDVVEKLKSQLEAARQARDAHAAQRKLHEAAKASQAPGRAAEEQELLLFRTDQSGRAWPVNAPSGDQEPRGGRRKKKAIETHVDGQRVRYFQNDDGMGLQEMVKREKMSSAQDQNALYSRMAAKMMGKTDGDNYTLDDMFVSSAAQREGEGQEEERMRNRAVGENRRLMASLDKCYHCFSSPELQKHLVVAIGSKAYLSLPAGVSMAEGHCLICPLQHHCCATGTDEDVWSEMQLFRRTLVRMFESQDLDCVFMETHMNPRARRHMVLECIPLPRELGDMAPIYFKKAIMECDDEWSMNKKVVDLSSKDIRHAVPRGLPYFAVDFGLQGGFAHVIENDKVFPPYFGKEVVGGMMDLEPRRWRKMIRENFDDQRKKVLQFAQWWKPFDCTKTES